MRLGPLGIPEIIIIIAILLLIFGARRLPEIGSSMGKGIRTFKERTDGRGRQEQARRPCTDSQERRRALPILEGKHDPS